MPRTLKTFGWCWNASSPEERKVAERRGEWHSQLRMIVASTTKAAAARAVGQEPRQLFNMGETWNPVSKALAEGSPGTVFIAPLNDARKTEDYEEWVPWGRFRRDEE
jgi:hypothetical protein